MMCHHLGSSIRFVEGGTVAEDAASSKTDVAGAVARSAPTIRALDESRRQISESVEVVAQVTERQMTEQTASGHAAIAEAMEPLTQRMETLQEMVWPFTFETARRGAEARRVQQCRLFRPILPSPARSASPGEEKNGTTGLLSL